MPNILCDYFEQPNEQASFQTNFHNIKIIIVSKVMKYEQLINNNDDNNNNINNNNDDNNNKLYYYDNKEYTLCE